MLETNDGFLVLRPIILALQKLAKEDLVRSVFKDENYSIKLINQPNTRETLVKLNKNVLEIVGSFEVGPDSQIDAEQLAKKIEKCL